MSLDPTPFVLAIANQKGGVGKTTTAVNLAAELASPRAPCWLLDLDPQGNASTALGLPRAERAPTLADVMTSGVALTACLREAQAAPGLWIAPAAARLATLAPPAHVLRRALAQALLATKPPAYVLIDCPPSLSTLTRAAFVAADGALAPVQCEFFALEGLAQLVRAIKATQVRLNPALDLFGIVLTMYDKRARLAEQVAEEVHDAFGSKTLRTRIPRNVRLAEAPSHGMPIKRYARLSSGARAYAALAREVRARARVWRAKRANPAQAA